MNSLSDQPKSPHYSPVISRIIRGGARGSAVASSLHTEPSNDWTFVSTSMSAKITKTSIAPSHAYDNTSTQRLQQINAHMATNGTSASTAFNANVVPQAPEDPMFGLMAAYRRDESDKKVDLGIGAYRDNNGKPWILPVVQQVRVAAALAIHEPGANMFARPTSSSAKTPTSTTNTSPLLVYPTSLPPRRNLSSAHPRPRSKRSV